MPSDLKTLALANAQPIRLAHDELQTLDPSRADELADAYFNAYPPGVACNSLNEAADEIRDTFAGEFGKLRLDASAMTEQGGRIMGAVLVVERSIWDGDLEGPFIVDLFVHPDAQGGGLGRALVNHAIAACIAAGDQQLSLRVGEDTSPAAHTLYKTLGFVSR